VTDRGVLGLNFRSIAGIRSWPSFPSLSPAREVPDDHCRPIHCPRHDPARLHRRRTARPRRVPGCPGCGISPETARSNPFASALTSAPSAASSSRSCPCGSARPTPPSWRCQKSSRCAPLPGDAGILTQVVAKNIRDLHRITGWILAVDGVVSSSTAISPDEVIPCWPHALLRVAAGSWRRPERSSPNSRRSLYSLRQWRDSHHLLFDREPGPVD
jgi:hypothetical protein